MDKVLQATGIEKRYKAVHALKPTDLVIEQGKIYGLLGRNGAGKTTLLSVLTAQNPATSGEVTYGGERVWENRKALENICFSRELSPMLMMGQNTYKGKYYLELARCYYPNWDQEYAKRLIDAFGFDPKKKICKLSKGMMSMLTIIIAMASRAPVTILDEPVAGLDVAMRDRFYRILLDDYEKTGRTFIVSTHIIEEASSVFEEIILMHDGQVLEKANTEDFTDRYRYVTGREDVVDAVVEGLRVVDTETLGRQKVACVEDLAGTLAGRAAGQEVDIDRVPLHKIFVYVTGGEKEGNIA